MRHLSTLRLGPTRPAAALGPASDAAPWWNAAEGRALRTALAALILTLLLVTFEPYQAVFVGRRGREHHQPVGIWRPRSRSPSDPSLHHATAGGDAASASRLGRDGADPPPLVDPSIWPDASFRAVVFSLAAMLAMTERSASCRTSGLPLRADGDGPRGAGLSYAGIVLMPSAAIHNEALEAANIGLWRGIYSHKNVAGPSWPPCASPDCISCAAGNG